MTIPTEYLQKIINGEIGIIDSTHAKKVAEELVLLRDVYLAADRCKVSWERGFSVGARQKMAFFLMNKIRAIDAWRKAAE